jgi:hypothetical protein
MSGDGVSSSVGVRGTGDCGWVSGLERSLAVVVRSMGWLSVEIVGAFGVPVSGVPSLEFVLVVSWSKMMIPGLGVVAMAVAVVAGWHWVPCRQAQSSRIV